MKQLLFFALICTLGFFNLSGQTLDSPAPASQAAGEFTFKGYYNITEMGLLIGSPENTRPAPFSFMTINGYHLTEQLSAGLGIGVEFPSGSYMPVVLDTRYYIRNSSFSPFLQLYGGYALVLDDAGSNEVIYYNSSYVDYYGGDQKYKAKGGWLLNPGFGIRNMFGENFGVIFSVGYRLQRLYFKSDARKLMVDYNRLNIKVGITFR